MDHWRSATPSNKRFPLTNIFTGVAPEVSAPSGSFVLQLSSTGQDPSDKMSCTLHLELRQYFFPTQDGKAQHVVVFDGDKIAEMYRSGVSSTRLGRWQISRTPYDLREFSQVWDLLHQTRSAAVVDKIDIERGVVLYNSTVYKVDSKRKVQNDSPVPETGIAPVERFKGLFSRTSKVDGSPAGRIEQFEAVVREWEAQDVEMVAATLCVGSTDKQGQEPKSLMIFPIWLRMKPFAWTRGWTEQAISSRSLHKNAMMPLSAPFEEAFADLDAVAEGFKTTSLEALDERLLGNLDDGSEDGLGVKIWEVTVPDSVLRHFGIFLIVIAQFYFVVQLREVETRLWSSAPGDPGVLKPWMILYKGSLAGAATMAMMLAPGATAILMMLLYFWTIPLTVNTTWVVVGAVVSMSASIWCLRGTMNIRRIVGRHREALEECSEVEAIKETEEDLVGYGG